MVGRLPTGLGPALGPGLDARSEHHQDQRPAGDRDPRQIKARAGVTIRYRVREGSDPVAIAASLDGLGAAIGSIR